MFKNYYRIAFQHLIKNKVFSTINILGLAIGMSVALLIGLWIWDELSFNHYHKNHARLGEVASIETFNGITTTDQFSTVPVAAALRNNYPAEFKHVSVTREINAGLVVGDKKIGAYGLWAEADFPAMLTPEMLEGSYAHFQDPSSVLISESLAKTLFGHEAAVNKIISFNNEFEMKVAGVYKNLPFNTDFRDVQFFLAWKNKNNSGNANTDDWLDHHFRVFVQLQDHASFAELSAKIRNLAKPHIPGGWEQLMLHPMDDWHLHTNFTGEGRNPTGRIQFVWLFGIIGGFVLLLACINFMNLSTARSERRAKEVGIRKTMGSSRNALIGQFIGESILMALISMVIALLTAQLFISFFNELASKQLRIPYLNFIFWICLLGFTFLTGLLAGSYPAFFLSAFKPVKVLKGNFRSGKFAAIPRKVMVVLQFTVCIALIIGTIVVYQQIQFAKNRPMGYSTNGLITVEMKSRVFRDHYDVFRNDLIQTGVVENVAESSSPSTEVRNGMLGYNWKGKDPNATTIMGTLFVTDDFGKTIHWQIIEGRDFRKDHKADSGAFILNEAAVSFTGLKNPVGETIFTRQKDNPIIGVVKNMIMENPYQPVQPVFFTLYDRKINFIIIRLKQGVPVHQALSGIEKVYSKYDPSNPFDYEFTMDAYARKFSDETVIGNISAVFCLLAIIISCLGLFGLASYIAEQRTKEIAVRKVLGASVFNLWRLLSSEFISLVLLSSFIAIPIAWYFIHHWLLKYEYRTPISGWVCIWVSLGTMTIALITVSFQIIKAAFLNPIRQLRSE